MKSELLNYKDGGRILIEDGRLYILAHENLENKSVAIHTQAYPDKGGWGSDNGNTVIYYKIPLDASKLESSSRELPNGETIVFKSLMYSHGSHIADRQFYEFAFLGDKCIGWCQSDPYSNPDRDFHNWRSRVSQNRCTKVSATI